MNTFSTLSLGEEQRSIVVGIDFGTTYSGIAWAETRKSDQQTIVNMWPSSLSTHEGNSMEKVPTELRYTAEGMEGLDRKSPASPGQQQSPETLTTDYLTAIYSHLMYTLEQKLGTSILRTIPLEFCLTVPAIWSEVAKEKTLQACKRAGIVSKSPILLVSEPEAAATHALHGLDPHGLKIGDSFVLCDAGGGTVDLISYTITQLQPILKIEETVPGSGGLCGSTFLNRRFGEFLTAKLEGEDGWDDELLAEAMERFDLVIKKQYSVSTSKQDGYTILVPGIANNERLGIKRGRLLVTVAELREIFEPVISEVIDLVRGQIEASGKKGKPIRAVLLVGGFGENTYLKDRLRAAFNQSIQVMQPPNAWTAVVRGAVMMGLGRAASGLAAVGVTSRAARKHYGIELQETFNKETHEDNKKYYCKKQKEYLACTLCWFIKRGEPVKESMPKQIQYYYPVEFPVSRGRPKSLDITVYCDEISLEAPVHMNSNVRSLVNLEADLRSISDRDLEATMKRQPDGKWYYKLSGYVQVTYLSASTEYVLFCEGKRYDTVTAEYV